jgi:hypothetical protein
LIRESKARPGTYAISLVIQDGRVEHHTLAPRNGAYTLNNKPMSRACSTLEDVVDHLTFTEESLSCTLRPNQSRQVIGNPGYQFAEDDQNLGGRPLVPNSGYQFSGPGVANPTLVGEEEESFYSDKPSNIPVDRDGYSNVPRDMDGSYMDLDDDADDASGYAPPLPTKGSGADADTTAAAAAAAPPRPPKSGAPAIPPKAESAAPPRPPKSEAPPRPPKSVGGFDPRLSFQA